MTVNDVITEVEAAIAPLRTERLLVEEIRRLQAKIVRLEDEETELAGALRDLHDTQNGPPLIRDAKCWRAAMDRSIAVLRIVEAEIGEVA